MNDFIIFTSCSLAYLPQATLLLRSIRKFHRECEVVLVLVEEKSVYETAVEQLLNGFDEIMYPEDIWGEQRFEKLFPYTVVEACTSIKGPALRRLLNRHKPVIYLDPDVVLFGCLQPLLDNLHTSSVVLTPHQLEPMTNDTYGEIFDEVTSLMTGTYNFGCLAVSPSIEGLAFADWWSERTTQYAFDDASRGLFTDQKWGNLIPVFFPSTCILRHRGCNVASWNIQEREIYFSETGDYMVGGDELIFYHFSKEKYGLHAVRQKSGNNLALASIWRWYLEELEEIREIVSRRQWSYEAFFNQPGEQIDITSRRAYGSQNRNARNPYPFWR